MSFGPYLGILFTVGLIVCLMIWGVVALLKEGLHEWNRHSWDGRLKGLIATVGLLLVLYVQVVMAQQRNARTAEREKTRVAKEKADEVIRTIADGKEKEEFHKRFMQQEEERQAARIAERNELKKRSDLEAEASGQTTDADIVQLQRAMELAREPYDGSRAAELQRLNEEYIRRTQEFIDGMPSLPQHPSEGMFDYIGATRSFIENEVARSSRLPQKPMKNTPKISQCGPNGCPLPPRRTTTSKASPKKPIPKSVETYNSPREVTRTWTSSDGSFSSYATLLNFDQRSVTLRTESGREVRVELSRLCKEDRLFIKTLSRVDTKSNVSASSALKLVKPTR